MVRAAYWQPMSTAPRDGTIVDLHLIGGGRYTDAWWDEEDGGTWCGLDEEIFDHWAPTPVHPIKPPSSAPMPMWFGISMLTLWLIFGGAVAFFIRSVQ